MPRIRAGSSPTTVLGFGGFLLPPRLLQALTLTLLQREGRFVACLPLRGLWGAAGGQFSAASLVGGVHCFPRKCRFQPGFLLQPDPFLLGLGVPLHLLLLWLGRASELLGTSSFQDRETGPRGVSHPPWAVLCFMATVALRSLPSQPRRPRTTALAACSISAHPAEACRGATGIDYPQQALRARLLWPQPPSCQHLSGDSGTSHLCRPPHVPSTWGDIFSLTGRCVCRVGNFAQSADAAGAQTWRGQAFIPRILHALCQRTMPCGRSS